MSISIFLLLILSSLPSPMPTITSSQLKARNPKLSSSAAQYLTFIASIGEQTQSIEMRYEGENIRLTQKMMAALYDVSVPAINQHLQQLKQDGEINVSTVKQYLIVQAERNIPMTMEDWANRLDSFLEFNGNEVLTDAGKISHEQAKLHAETQYEKYRITQDRLFESDFDKFTALEGEVKVVTNEK